MLEFPILVLAEQRHSHVGQGVGFQQLEALFERVVDVDLGVAVEDDDAARARLETIVSVFSLSFSR